MAETPDERADERGKTTDEVILERLAAIEETLAGIVLTLDRIETNVNAIPSGDPYDY